MSGTSPSLDPVTEDRETSPRTLKEAREQLEREMILDALHRHQGRISDASRELGLSRPACIELALKLGIAVT